MMNNNLKKAMIATLFGATALFACASASHAEVLTSADQRFTLETPDSAWKEIPDQTTKMTLTDGDNYVTVRCYDKEEALKDLANVLPMPTVAHDEFEEEVMTYYSTDKDVYVITGLAETRDDIQDVRAIVNSIQLSDHAKPKMEEKKQEQKKEEKKEEKKEDIVQRTDEMYTLFNENQDSFIVYKYTDGTYRGEDGTLFQNNNNGDWIDYYGNHYSTTGAIVTAEKTGYSFQVQNELGKIVTVYEYTDHTFRSDDNNLFDCVDEHEYIDFYGNHYQLVTGHTDDAPQEQIEAEEITADDDLVYQSSLENFPEYFETIEE